MRQQLSSAEPLFRRALAIWEESLTQSDARIRLAIENLAVLSAHPFFAACRRNH